MKRLLLAFLFLSTLLRAAGLVRVNEAPGVLPAGASQALNAKLAALEREMGVRVLVEFHLKSPTEDEDKIPGAFMHALAEKLGTAERGVLAVYFADDSDWRLWIGDQLAERFAGKPGSVAALTENKAIHDAKETLFARAKARADAAEKDLKSPQHLAAEADALIDELALRLKR